MSNVNNNNHISIYYYAKSIYSISGISFARLLKTSKSSLYIYFIPLCIDIVGVIDGTFTISMSFRVSILKYICTLICLQVNKAQILRQAHAYSIRPLKIDLQFQNAFVWGDKAVFSQRRGQINIIVVNYVRIRSFCFTCINLPFHCSCRILAPNK